MVTHFGRSEPIHADTLEEAKRKLDQIRPGSSKTLGNCLQLLDPNGEVLSYLLIDPEKEGSRWP